MAPSKSAYTLIEILIVLGIVAVLAAIAFPVFASARHSVYNATCQSNLRQIQLAITHYTTDYDGKYPLPNTGASLNNSVAKNTFVTWRVLLEPYTTDKQWLFACPEMALPSSWSDSRGNQWASGYSMNDNLHKTVGHKQGNTIIASKFGVHEVTVRYPAITVTVAEARPAIVTLGQPDNQPMLAGLGSYVGNSDTINLMDTLTYGAIVHQGGSNYAFADGHSKWYGPGEVSGAEESDGIHCGFGL